jgi:hypothetical protein
MIQIAKLVSYYDLQKSECIIKNTPGCNKNELKMSTSVLSYFIIKGCLFYNFDLTLKFVDDNLFFNNRENEYIKMICSTMQNKKFHEKVNEYIIELPEFGDILKSLRMTCTQIE